MAWAALTCGVDLFAIRHQAQLEAINTLTKKELLQLSPQEIESMGGAELFEQAGTPEQIDGKETKTILLLRHDRTTEFKGLDYLTDFVLPNVYFHVNTSYAILRHKSVEIGKKDFLGNI